jgi:hypothetical protein
LDHPCGLDEGRENPSTGADDGRVALVIQDKVDNSKTLPVEMVVSVVEK